MKLTNYKTYKRAMDKEGIGISADGILDDAKEYAMINGFYGEADIENEDYNYTIAFDLVDAGRCRVAITLDGKEAYKEIDYKGFEFYCDVVKTLGGEVNYDQMTKEPTYRFRAFSWKY